jgi:hypothetical protein
VEAVGRLEAGPETPAGAEPTTRTGLS